MYVTHDQIEAMTLAHRVALIDKGVLQQLDTPACIYSQPANLFVAGFIGSPPMNFIHGALIMDGFQATDLRVGVTVHRGGEAILGVRPEDCSLTEVGSGDGQGRIYSVELIGDHTLVTLKVGEQSVVVKAVNTYAAEIGTPVGVHLNRQRIHFFDSDSGLRLPGH